METMTIDFTSLIFIWLLLPLTAAFPNDSVTVMTTGEAGNVQVTTQEASSSNPLSEASALQTGPPTTSKTFLENIQTAATPTDSMTAQFNGSNGGIESTTELTAAATMAVTSRASAPAITTGVPPMLGSSTQSQNTGKTVTTQFISENITHPSTFQTQPTNDSAATTTTKPTDNESTSASRVTGGDAAQSTRFHKTSQATTKTPIHHTTKPKKTDRPPPAEPQDGTKHGKIVAGIIGGALALMMLGFLVIYMKKRKLQRQQTSTSDWAGPSPFLDGGDDNGQVSRRSSNRISLSSFLPQRMSKRLSLLPETDEELEEITPGTTFGDKGREGKSGQEVNGNHAQENNGTAVVLEMKSTGDTTETEANSVPVSPSETTEQLPTDKTPEVTKPSEEDHPANPPTLSGDAEKASAQGNDGQG